MLRVTFQHQLQYNFHEEVKFVLLTVFKGLMLAPYQYGIFGANTDTRETRYKQENSNIRYISQYSLYNILNVVIKYI